MKIPVRLNAGNISLKGQVNEDKLLNNLIRAKTTIREYAVCNEFDYFVTLTLDKAKYDRYNLDAFIKDLGQFIRDYRKKYDADIQYILIPEQHEDGAWHLHGLMKGIKDEHMIPFDEIERAPAKLKGKDYYNFTKYADKFGFNSMGKIKNRKRCASYITKYIDKQIGKSIEINRKSYYCSRGLKKPEVIKKGTLQSALEYEFENEYCKIKYSNTIDSIIIADVLTNMQ